MRLAINLFILLLRLTAFVAVSAISIGFLVQDIKIRWLGAIRLFLMRRSRSYGGRRVAVSYESARQVLDLIERQTHDKGAPIPIVPTWVVLEDGQFSSG